MERQLERLPVLFRVWRLPPRAPWPPPGLAEATWAFAARTPDEIALLLPADAPPPPQGRPGPYAWHGWRVVGTLGFDLVGVLADLSRALAQAGISLLAVSTFDTDYIFVRADQRAAAEAAWRAAGWEVLALDAAG